MRFLGILLISCLTLIGCSKDDFEGEGDLTSNGTIEINVSQSANQGTGDEESIILKWQNSANSTDMFSVFGDDGNYVGDFKYTGTNGATDGVFVSIGDFSMNYGEEYTAVFPKVDGSKVTNLTIRDSEEILKDAQEYSPKLEDVNKYTRLNATFTFTRTDPQLVFENEMSYQLLNVTLPLKSYAKSITFKDGSYDRLYTIKMPDDYTSEVIKTYIAIKPNAEATSRNIEVSITDQNAIIYFFTELSEDKYDAGLCYDLGIGIDKFEILELPYRVDNTQLKYFRPVFNQDKNSCGQGSGIGYIFTYEINRLRNVSGQEFENQYPSHWTWLMLTSGRDAGSISWHGWDIVKNIGVPNLVHYRKDNVEQTSERRMYAFGMEQMSGYDKWFNALQNKLTGRKSWNPSASKDGDADFNEVKEYLAHHGDNSDTGGVVGIWSNSSGLRNNLKTIAEGQYGAGEKIITTFGDSGGHLMTIAGYNDEIGYDLNNDGEITNHIDINNDGVVNRLDWEKGAFLLVNSWGKDWANDGKAWMMYRLISESKSGGYADTRGVFHDSKDAKGRMWTCAPKIDYKPEFTLKLNYYHSMREKVTFKIGVALDENASSATHTITCSRYYGGFWGLGDIPVKGVGKTNVPIEICIDATSLLGKCPGLRTAKRAKFFFSATATGGTGTINDISVVSYLNDSNGLFKAFPETNKAFPAQFTSVLDIVE